VLQEKKKEKVILLTTHSMDEADLLADRKAILSAGDIRCIGSSLFLKSRFGLGYNLNLAFNDKSLMPKLEGLIKEVVPEASIKQEKEFEVSFQLPTKSSSGSFLPLPSPPFPSLSFSSLLFLPFCYLLVLI